MSVSALVTVDLWIDYISLYCPYIYYFTTLLIWTLCLKFCFFLSWMNEWMNFNRSSLKLHRGNHLVVWKLWNTKQPSSRIKCAKISHCKTKSTWLKIPPADRLWFQRHPSFIHRCSSWIVGGGCLSVTVCVARCVVHSHSQILAALRQTHIKHRSQSNSEQAWFVF